MTLADDDWSEEATVAFAYEQKKTEAKRLHLDTDRYNMESKQRVMRRTDTERNMISCKTFYPWCEQHIATKEELIEIDIEQGTTTGAERCHIIEDRRAFVFSTCCLGT